MNQDVKDELVLHIEQTLEIKAAPDKTFEGLIRQMTDMEGEPGKGRIKLKLERQPGGRWFRDLGSNTGHLWGFVQSIKPPALLEIFGPMMMSFPVAGHLIVRLAEIPGGTRLVFKSEVFGPIPAEYREGMAQGWAQMLSAVKRDVEG